MVSKRDAENATSGYSHLNNTYLRSMTQEITAFNLFLVSSWGSKLVSGLQKRIRAWGALHLLEVAELLRELVAVFCPVRPKEAKIGVEF